MLTEKQLMEAVGYHCSLENCRAVERAVIAAYEAKLLEQTPVGYFDQEYSGGPVLIYQVNYSHKDREGVFPLYLRPAPIPEGIQDFIHQFKRHVGGDGEFWLHELEDFYDKMAARSGEWQLALLI